MPVPFFPAEAPWSLPSVDAAEARAEADVVWAEWPVDMTPGAHWAEAAGVGGTQCGRLRYM